MPYGSKSPNNVPVPKQPSPRQQRDDFHRRHVIYHQEAAKDHAKRGEADAEQRHQAAAVAHAALTDGRDDTPAEGTALRLSGMAEQATYQAIKDRGRV